MRVQFNGRTLAFQARYVGSIPITRSQQAMPVGCACSSVGQSSGLLSHVSGVRIPAGTFCGGYGAVGQRARLWLWRSRVRVPVSTLKQNTICIREQIVFFIITKFMFPTYFYKKCFICHLNSLLSKSKGNVNMLYDNETLFILLPIYRDQGIGQNSISTTWLAEELGDLFVLV